MNERMRELARKANMVEVEYSPGFPDIRYPKNFEKFAELIVRECMDVVLDKDGKEWAGYVHVCREESADMIKKHFGVEEWLTPS